MKRKTDAAAFPIPRLPLQVRPVDRTLAASARLVVNSGVVPSQNAAQMTKIECHLS
jgi:hypothetical protein